MKSKKSISRFYRIFLFTIAFLIVFIFGSLSIIELHSKFTRDSRSLINEYIKAQKEIVKIEIEGALDFIEWRKNSSSLSDVYMQKEVLDWLSKIRFPNRGNEPGFLFVRSVDGYSLMSFSTPELVGKDLSSKLDSDSINSHELFIKAIENSEGDFVEYSWFNPYTKINSKKVSFVKEVPEWDWYIGAGFWLDDINSVIEIKRAEMKLIVRKYVVIILLAMLLILLILYFNISYLTKKMNSSFTVFSEFFSKAEKQSAKIDVSKIEFSELKELADSANKMIEMRERAYFAMRESEDRWQFALEGSRNGVWDWNLTNNEVFFSKRWKEMLGYEVDDLENKLEEWEKRVHPEDIDQVYIDINKHLNGEVEFYESEYRMSCKDGSYIWILDRGKVIEWSKDNKPIRLIGTHTDINEIKIAEEKLKHSHHLMNDIIEHNKSGVAVHDRDMNYIYVSNRYLIDYNLEGQDLIGKYHYDVFPDLPQKWRDVHQKALIGEISGSEMDPYYKEDGTVEWTRWECRPWYENDESIGGVIIYTESISDRVEALAKLETEKDFSEKIIETSNAIILGFDKNHIIRIFNKGAELITGYTKDEVLGKGWFQMFFSEDKLQEMNKVWKEAWGLSAHSYINPILTKTGEKRIISWQNTGMYDDEDVNKHILISIGEDITERVQTEAMIKESEANLKSLIENRGDSIWSVDKDLNFIIFNSFFASKYKASFNIELKKGMNAIEILTPELAEFFEPKYVAVLKGEYIVFEFNQEIGGINHFFQVSMSPIISDNRISGVSALSIDITNIKEAETALRESKNFNETLLEISPDLIYIYDLEEKKIVYSNNRIHDILGYSPEEIKQMGSDLFVNLLSSEDFIQYQDSIFPKYMIAKDKELIQHEYRMKSKEGEWCWLRSKEFIFKRNEDASPKQIFGIIEDISNWKETEKQLADYRQKLEELVESRTMDLENKNNTLERVNQAFAHRELRMKKLKEEIANLKAKST